MPLLDKSIVAKLYKIAIKGIDDSALVKCKIEYQTMQKTYDNINQVYTGTPTTHTYDVYCIANEQKQSGYAISSQIVEGVPTGLWKIHLKYVDRFIKPQDYVENSIRFVLRPDTDNPTILYPNLALTRVDYFLEDEAYPLTQRHICSLVKERM